MTIEILDKGEDDFVNGFKFYEEQQPGLGEYFRESLSADIDSLRVHGGVHQVVYRNYHRALSKRFPFALFYTVSGEMVFVHAERRPTDSQTPVCSLAILASLTVHPAASQHGVLIRSLPRSSSAAHADLFTVYVAASQLAPFSPR